MAFIGRTAVLKNLLRENGIRWLVAFAASEAFRRATRGLDRYVERVEGRRHLPGFFGPETQRVIWDTYDWSRSGEEWTASDEWKNSIIAELLLPHARGVDRLLEIGPGAGRWTSELQPITKTLAVVDISSATLAECRRRLRASTNVQYTVNDGRTLPFAPAVFDRIWSFDVFVHIGAEDTASYLSECLRVLRPGGRAMIHHTADGGIRGRWRSHMTAEMFVSLARAAGLVVLDQFDEWRHAGHNYDLHDSGDAVTVVEKPANGR